MYRGSTRSRNPFLRWSATSTQLTLGQSLQGRFRKSSSPAVRDAEVSFDSDTASNTRDARSSSQLQNSAFVLGLVVRDHLMGRSRASKLLGLHCHICHQQRITCAMHAGSHMHHGHSRKSNFAHLSSSSFSSDDKPFFLRWWWRTWPSHSSAARARMSAKQYTDLHLQGVLELTNLCTNRQYWRRDLVYTNRRHSMPV